MMGASLTPRALRRLPPGPVAPRPLRAHDDAMETMLPLLAWLGVLALIGWAPKELAQLGLMAAWLLLLGAAGVALWRLLF